MQGRDQRLLFTILCLSTAADISARRHEIVPRLRATKAAHHRHLKVGLISEFRLFDTETQQQVGEPLVDGSVVRLPSEGLHDKTFSIWASETEGTVGSIVYDNGTEDKFRCGKLRKTETRRRVVYPCNDMIGTGNYRFTATAYAEKKAGGDKGDEVEISFAIRSEDDDDDSRVPTEQSSDNESEESPSDSSSNTSSDSFSTPSAASSSTESESEDSLSDSSSSSVNNVAFPLDGKWLETDAKADIQARHEACFVFVDNPTVGRRAYLIGGRNKRRTDIYDPATRKWTKGATPPIQLHHMQCVAAQGKIWLMSPWTGSFPREVSPHVAYMYDPAIDAFVERKALPTGRQRGSAAVVVSKDEQTIWVSHGTVGGHEKGNHAVSVGMLDAYDIGSDSWTALSNDAPHPRDHTGGALINDRLCVAGGRDGGTIDWPIVLPTDCYNFARRRWEVEAPIPAGRGGSSYGTTCDGKLMVAGGERGSQKIWNRVDVFDGKEWETMESSLQVARHGSGLAVDCDCNQIYIASGAGNKGGGPELQSVETYFPDGKDTACKA